MFEVDAMDSSIPNCIMNWLKTLPWSTLIVGIVVPVASAYRGKWGQVPFPTIYLHFYGM